MSNNPAKSVSDERPLAVEGGDDIKDTVSNISKLALSSKPPRSDLYSDLPLGHYIRLLTLFPGAVDDTIRTELTVWSLSEAPQYDAISYVWGAPTKPVPVQLDGEPFHITANLHAALVRVRYSDRLRIVWADAICINQRNIKERGHHVGFMGAIYSQAETVLVCLGPDVDGGAEDVASLVRENRELLSGYDKKDEEAPVLMSNDPTFSDPRWPALGKLFDLPWFSRAWVLQEVGLAKNPKCLYGDVDFSYRDLMNLANWIEECADHLRPRAGVESSTIHTEWFDWSQKWYDETEDHECSFIDLIINASCLKCADPKDHIYALLGHPYARGYGDGETIVKPDYSKRVEDVYLDVVLQLLTDRKGGRILSAVEHDEDSIAQDLPSWVLDGTMAETLCTLGVLDWYYYEVSAGLPNFPFSPCENNCLQVRGVILDPVVETFKFYKADLKYFPIPDRKDIQTENDMLCNLWRRALESSGSSKYSSEYVTAFSLTLVAGLTGIEAAEENLSQHQTHFAAFQKYRLALLDKNEDSPESPQDINTADLEKFWMDLKMACYGRSFIFTKNGYYALGPMIAKPGDLCCVIFGAKVPYVLRKAGKEGRYKLVGEAYVHGMMHSEVKDMLDQGSVHDQDIILC